MSKKPKSRFNSPFVIARSSNTSITSFSPSILRGVVRGLLSHLCLQKKGSLWSNRWLQKAENKIMITATAAMEKLSGKELTEDQASRLIEVLSNEIQRMLRENRKHTYRTLNADSDRIISALTRDEHASRQGAYDKLTLMRPYDDIDREEHRVEWLKEEIPAILQVLQKFSYCLDPVCVKRLGCTAPPPDTLKKWAKTSHAGVLRNNILGHFHGISPERVKRLLTDRPKTSPLR